MSLITIAGGLGSGGTKIAQLVADGLKLELYDDERLQQEAIKMGIRPEELRSMDEMAPGFFDQLWSSKPELYVDLMESVVYGLAGKGEGVILGHGSQLLLRDFSCALHVLIHATESVRIKHLMDQHGFSKGAAEKLIQKSDHKRRGFMQFAFHMDWNDSSLYDLVINTGKTGPDWATKIIVEAARSEEIRACSLNALDAMERLSVTKKIKAELLRNHFDLSMLHVEVPEKGVVHISGWLKTRGANERLVKLLNDVPGVENVRSEISVGLFAPETIVKN